jgi:hypothetical protein
MQALSSSGARTAIGRKRRRAVLEGLITGCFVPDDSDARGLSLGTTSTI